MDTSRLGIVLVVDAQRCLVRTITDGDVRRALLANLNLEQPVTTLLRRKAGTRYAQPITALVGVEPERYLSILKRHRITHLPLVDEQGHIAGLVRLDDFLPRQPIPLQAVVMAGGRGRRLHPLTQDTPKPMLRVGDRPLLEIIISQLRDAGIRRVKVSTHHHSKQIADHFGDGSEFGIELSYVTEDRPLGTVGSLGLLEPPNETTLVINGDILTGVDFRAMLAYHHEHQADLTMAVRHHEVKIPYGVVECDGPAVRRVQEKPVMGFLVNAGIYLLEPMAYRFIPSGQRFDMTDLIGRLLAEERTVVSFPIRESWLDIGEHDDFAQAQEHVKRLGVSP